MKSMKRFVVVGWLLAALLATNLPAEINGLSIQTKRFYPLRYDGDQYPDASTVCFIGIALVNQSDGDIRVPTRGYHLTVKSADNTDEICVEWASPKEPNGVEKLPAESDLSIVTLRKGEKIDMPAIEHRWPKGTERRLVLKISIEEKLAQRMGLVAGVLSVDVPKSGRQSKEQAEQPKS